MVESKRPIPVGISFHASWWHENYGIKFDQVHYTNPEYRIENDIKMRKILYERFGDIGLGESNPEPILVVSGYGIATIPALLGCKMVFLENDEPYALTSDLNDKEIEELKIPENISEFYPLNEIIKNAEKIREKYGKVEVCINWQGVQNIALKIRGEQLFVDYYTNPELAHKVLSIVTEMIIKVVRFFEKRFGTSKEPNRLYTTSNCTVDLVSNEIYEEFLLRYDSILGEEFKNLGIHHCGIVDKSMPGYQRVKNLKFLEAGWGSDIRKAREGLPNLQMNCRYGPVRIQGVSAKQVEDDIRKLIESGAPSISVVGVDTKTPDENIRVMFNTVAKHNLNKMEIRTLPYDNIMATP
ncbi:MAG: hypothetical protein HY606_00540 [Planctomycetes bacterium]|nr:hypothetical protein [Planctomycetota bacterium]